MSSLLSIICIFKENNIFMKNKLLFLPFVFLLNTLLINGANTIGTNSVKESKVTNADALADEAVVMDAMHEFKSLTRVEKKMRLKEVKKEIAKFKEENKSGNTPSTSTLLLVLIALLLPPLAVYLHEGDFNGKFWLSVLLTLIFWIPGVIYALFVIL